MKSNPAGEKENEAGPACAFCRGRFDVGYHFTCHRCGATYCYAHMSRHLGAHGMRIPQEPRILTAREADAIAPRFGGAVLKPNTQEILG